MTAAVEAEPLSAFGAITLAELVAHAALQSRMDRKYILPADRIGDLVAGLAHQACILEIDVRRSFWHESMYFDTPDLCCYRLAALRRRRRFKVRSRCYTDSGECWLEVKVRGARGRTIKHRLPYLAEQRATIEHGREFVTDTLDRESIPLPYDAALAPTLLTRYQRSTLFLPATASRVTIDTQLCWEHAGRHLYLPDLAIVETKTAAAASCADRLLWRRCCRPIRISKYATGLAALRPDLPAVPWRRTLRRHLLLPGTAHPSWKDE